MTEIATVGELRVAHETRFPRDPILEVKIPEIIPEMVSRLHGYWYLDTDALTHLHHRHTASTGYTTLLVVVGGRRNYWRAKAAAIE